MRPTTPGTPATDGRRFPSGCSPPAFPGRPTRSGTTSETTTSNTSLPSRKWRQGCLVGQACSPTKSRPWPGSISPCRRCRRRVQDAAVLALANAADQLSPADRQLYDRALYRSRPGTLAAEFRKDVESGRLPQVSYLVPSEVDSEHPSGSSPAASATLLYQVLDAIASDPDLWAKTAVIVNFDENDGYFDHVPPPRPPRSVEAEWVGNQPLGLGPRVPMTIISPWTVGGFVCSQGVRPHVRHAVPGDAVRNHATGNRPVATHGEWRPDVGVRLRQPA